MEREPKAAGGRVARLPVNVKDFLISTRSNAFSLPQMNSETSEA